MRIIGSVVILGVVLFAACGGSTDREESPGPEACTTLPVDGNLACVPGRAPANQPLAIEVNQTRNCLQCKALTTEVRSECAVSVSGSRIMLRMSVVQCPKDREPPCTFECRPRLARCDIPALPPRTYSVEIEGEGARHDRLPRELVVEAGEGKTLQASCALGAAVESGVESTLPFDPRYPQACANDEDCRPVFFGNVCQPCRCPTDAISTADDTYDADLRAAASRCDTRRLEGGSGPNACAPCAATKAVCVSDPAGGPSNKVCRLQTGF